jgi:cysteine-rich repeat protein
MVGSTCAACSSLINGCADCSAPTICLTCDGTLNFTMENGNCLCTSSNFLNATNNCQPCVTALIGCDTCADSVTCTSCLTASQFILLGNNTCGCAPTFVPVGTSCVSCFVSCVCYGYQFDSAGLCTSFCSDNITISPTEECDDGNLDAGDGCSPTCTTEANYTCVVDSLLQSSCSYNQRVSISLISTIKSPNSNQLTFNLALEPANIPNLPTLNFSQLFSTSIPLGSPSFVLSSGVLELTYPYNQSLHG